MTTDAGLKRRVEDELRWDTRVDAAHIGVTASDGSVTLSGHVSSFPEKYAATSSAKSVYGVKALADEIEINLPSEYRRDDSDIAERIAHVLEWNVSIPDNSVKAEVRKGFVTLTGTVDWQHQRNHIEEQVSHVGSVVGIANQIAIKNRATPADVKKQIEAALKRNAKLEAEKISVSVAGNKVTLDGSVKAYYERDLVERAAWAAPGVSFVVDHIRVA